MSVSLAVQNIINSYCMIMYQRVQHLLLLGLHSLTEMLNVSYVEIIHVCVGFFYFATSEPLSRFLNPKSPPKGATIPYRPSPSPAALLIAGNQVREWDFTRQECFSNCGVNPLLGACRLNLQGIRVRLGGVEMWILNERKLNKSV